ncbi:uncharacterized protein LOC123398731 isoform X1 [Hordeum vulgare subsp. vulgare]|uniref:uncharacterized protein LOC123398731 isoform X1 n=1 Tax=Hordeum vulgare subsp. vulgare TaxID=112509 RepID=UPI001D1A5092|nr:uncharacterized protein LOC123398731 isoform X1 [Hordeum vulgare subsp. vulgare]
MYEDVSMCKCRYREIEGQFPNSSLHDLLLSELDNIKGRFLSCTIYLILVLYFKVLKRDIPWETYMSTKLITSTCLQLLRRYDHKPESQRGPLLDEEDDDAAINVSMIESRASQLQSFALNDFVAYA